MTEPRDDLAADQPPACQRHHQGRQPHPRAVRADVRPQRQQVVVPAERRFGRSEPSVVIGHVAGVFGYPGHGQDVAVVGCVGADEVPPHQHGGHHSVQRRQRPPPPRQDAFDPSAVCGVQDVQGAEGDHGQRHPGDHRQHLQQRRRTAISGIDRRRELQARRGGTGQVGEDADDLRPEVIAATFAAQRFAGVVGIAARHQADEFAGDLVGVRGEREAPARRAEHLVQRGADHRRVADDDEQIVVDAFDEQSAVDGLRRLLRHGREQHGLARSGQSRGRAARHGDVEVGGDVSDQWRVDTLQHAVLRPVELRGGLRHRQQGGGDRQCRAEQPGDDGDDARGAMVARSGHGARW